MATPVEIVTGPAATTAPAVDVPQPGTMTITTVQPENAPKENKNDRTIKILLSVLVGLLVLSLVVGLGYWIWKSAQKSNDMIPLRPAKPPVSTLPYPNP